MKPVDQTKFGLEGNCMAACLASILEVNIEDVQAKETDNWFKDVNLWLQKEHRLALMTVSGSPFWFEGHLIVGGPGPRDQEHACVGARREWVITIVHDPHPSRDGLLKKEDYMVLVKAD